ncbi:hypothetical protein Tco_1315333 [Tanacetum coccineum]
MPLLHSPLFVPLASNLSKYIVAVLNKKQDAEAQVARHKQKTDEVAKILEEDIFKIKTQKVSKILGFPSISLGLVNGSKWAPCLARVRGNRDLRTWNPFRGCGIPSAEGLRRPLMASYVHFATSGPRQRGTRLSPDPLCFLIVLLGLGPRKAYVVQARRHALRNIRHQVPQSIMSIACDFVACNIITDIKSVLTQKALKIFCETFRIPDEVDAFACPASFPWNTSKSVSKDPFPKSSKFNAEHYATLVAYSALFIRRVVPLRPVAPARAENELEASVDKLFDESGSGNLVEQGNSASCGQGVSIHLISEAVETVVEDVAPLQPMRQKKRPTAVVDAGEPSHPAKRLRGDHGTPGGAPIGGKSMLVVQRLLVGVVQNAEVRVKLFLPCPSTNVAEAEVDSVVRSSIPIMTVATTVTSTVDPATIVKENFVESSLFSGGSSSAGGANHIIGGFFDLTGSDFIVSGIRTVISPDTDLQKVIKHDQLFTEFNVGAAWQMSLSAQVRMRAEYNIKEKRRLKSVVDEQTELLKVREREIENFKAQLLLNEPEVAEAIHLRPEASNLEVVNKYLLDEVQALRERNATLKKEKNDLDVKVVDLEALVKVREYEVADLDVVVTFVKSQNDNLVAQLERFQDKQMKVMNDKFDKLYIDLIEMALYLEEKFYPHILTTIAGRRWILTHDMELAIAKCLNSPEYISALGAAISKAIEKGKQDGLADGITHGKEGRVLTDVAAYNPSAKVDYISALQKLQNVNFSLLAELKLNKDSSIKTLMNILLLEETLTERLGLNESQPHVDQLMVSIHHSLDQTAIGATALSLALNVSSSRVWRIKDNIVNHRSALRDVFIPLAKPFSTAVLMGTEGTSGIIPGITTTLSTTFAFASLIPPISTYYYEIVSVDDQAVAGGKTNPFPNVDDA